jgi:glutathione S-transferase
MNALTMENPTFVAYAVAAAVMILKIMGQGWMTVYRMTKVEGGYLNPEDLLPGRINRNPNPAQLEKNDYVERSRRMHLNDMENIPPFLVAGLLFVAVEPAYPLAVLLMAVFVGARLVHTLVYATAQRHEVRATPYTIGSLVVIFMALYTLGAALIRL